MEGYIRSWTFGSGNIKRCPDNAPDSFGFNLAGVTDNELSLWLQQSGSFSDSGPCPGRKVPVQFVVQGGLAVGVGRLHPQVSWKEF
jgi:hypothetical protein